MAESESYNRIIGPSPNDDDISDDPTGCISANTDCFGDIYKFESSLDCVVSRYEMCEVLWFADSGKTVWL